MNINIEEIPFSRQGSYFVLSYLKKWNSIVLRDIHGGDMSPSELFLVKIEGEVSDLTSKLFQETYEVRVTETCFRLQKKCDSTSYLEIIYPTDRTIRMKTQNLSVSFEAVKERYDTFYMLTNQVYEYISYKKDQRYHFVPLSGSLEIENPWNEVGNTKVELFLAESAEVQELLILNDKVVPRINNDNLSSFEEVKEGIEKEYSQWQEALLIEGKNLSHSDEMASYLLWSCQVHEEKMLTRPSLYMSKNWMQNIWSWDNCFSALGIAKVDPELAYNQFLIFVDHQDESGAYPDFINDVYASFSCVKPPIHAWAYQRLMEQSVYFQDAKKLQVIYDSISRSTNYWLNHRKHPETELYYYSHGNDSGWDNASIFKAGMPVSSPDLVAYLACQCAYLSEWANQLGNLEESRIWKEKKQGLMDQLMTRYYNYDRQQFVALEAKTGKELPYYDSLILYMPLVLGNELPVFVKDRLVEQLIQKFEGEYGLSTESMASKYYRQSGYWLGPIWAPVSYLLISSLRKASEEKFARRLADKFCRMTELGGMAENFDPVTAKGNDDLAFTWTSSVYLMLNQNNF